MISHRLLLPCLVLALSIFGSVGCSPSEEEPRWADLELEGEQLAVLQSVANRSYARDARLRNLCRDWEAAGKPTGVVADDFWVTASSVDNVRQATELGFSARTMVPGYVLVPRLSSEEGWAIRFELVPIERADTPYTAQPSTGGTSHKSASDGAD